MCDALLRVHLDPVRDAERSGGEVRRSGISQDSAGRERPVREGRTERDRRAGRDDALAETERSREPKREPLRRATDGERERARTRAGDHAVTRGEAARSSAERRDGTVIPLDLHVDAVREPWLAV